MSNLATHEAEQAAITALCEAGKCGHPECKADHEYLFDVKLFASIRVRASNLETARAMLDEALGCANANLGAWPNGDPILCEASADGEADLIEVDGEDAQ